MITSPPSFEAPITQLSSILQPLNQMIQSKQFQFSLLTWAQLLVLFVPSVSLGAAAQSAVQPVPSFASHQNWDPSIAAIVGALFCAFLFMGFFSIYLRRCSESYLTVQNHIGTSEEWPCSCSQGVDRKVIDTFPILVYSTIKDLKIGKQSLECAVCLNEFKDYETLRLLPKCNHVFHPTCIDTWLSSHVTCPVCRDKLNPDCGEVVIEVPTQSNANELDEGSPISRDEQDETEDQHPGVPDVNEAQRSGNSGEADIVTVDEATGKQSPPLNSTRFGELTRSNSTGHSQVEHEKNVERYTLRLPEDVRNYILRKHGSIRRSASCNMIMPMVGSSRKGFCCSNNVEQQERWVLSRAPPFVSRQC